MLKFFLILIIIFYLIYRIGGFFFRMLFTKAFQQHQNQYRQHQTTSRQYSKTPPNSNVRVDYVPKEERNDRKDFNGGQYVDYEEVR